MSANPLIALCVVIGALLSHQFLDAAEPVDFTNDIAPILEQHCLRCHSPGISKGDVSLATISDIAEQQHIVPGDPAASYLLELVTSVDGKPPQMPKAGDALSKAQVDKLRQWIQAGAKWPQDSVLREPSQADKTWWSLQPLKATLPAIDSNLPPAWQRNPVDRFVFKKLAAKKLQPNPPAERRELIRRATYDLIGLPPSPTEIEAFVNDTDPAAFEKLIDRLLASPHYGERWGRHWLDVVRFGESNGYERNVLIPNLWPFRDYVIKSLNDDKPFDQFFREHLAGDVFGRGKPEVEVATAFLVAGPYDDVGNQDAAQAAQIRANHIDEMIRSSSEAFLGITVGCARCHDHKFDPILQQDYYALYATFAGVRHGSRTLGTPEQQAEHAARLKPLTARRDELAKQRAALVATIQKRGQSQLAEARKSWTRPSVDRRGTEETFAPVEAKFVRLVSEGQDSAPGNTRSFGIDEFEIWSTETPSRNVALAKNGSVASGPARQIQDFPGAYGPQLAIDGKTGARFLATGGQLTIQLAEPVKISRVVFSSARGETTPEHRKFAFVGEYRIEVSLDGKNWKSVANSHDRLPVNTAHQNHRLRTRAQTPQETQQLRQLDKQIAAVNRQIAAIPALPNVFIGLRDAGEAKKPCHLFIGGSPQRPGKEVVPASLSVLSEVTPQYELPANSAEDARRLAFADWVVHSENPLTPRVLANRLWHYHFGTGIVDTPSDLGYMGGRPSHPELLDWLAVELQKNRWQLKAMHKLIMLSQTWQQSSEYRKDAADVDGDARLLWRFPPRRLSAEEIRDTMLVVADRLDKQQGGPGFRLYQFLQDNVCTYIPLDVHGPETYRRAVYHQNARASVVDLMTEFDQPDCAFSTARRAATTTPLQALTMLNHQFTLDMAEALADRLRQEVGSEPAAQIKRAWQLCYGRLPTDSEIALCEKLIKEHSLAALGRVLFNSSELIYVK